MYRNVLVPLVLSAGSALPALADTIHVDPCGDDAWTGASAVCAAPDGPKRTIQGAIEASVDGDTVLVADGVYTGPGNRNMDFGGRAITVRSAGGAAACTIDCQATLAAPRRAFHFHSGEIDSSVLQGFTIRNGWVPDFGGAVLCQISSPRIVGCNFVHNGTERGGAVYIVDAPIEVVMVGCTFEDNTSTQTGGAIFARDSSLNLSRCTFSHNTGDGGGAILSAGVGTRAYTDCTFTGNITTNPAGNGGGAIQSQGSEPPLTDRATDTFTNCTFAGNRAGRLGGGVWASRQVDVTATNCKFIGNYAPVRASGLAVSYASTGVITNCLFASNTGQASVGALWIGAGVGTPSSATVANCTFAGNGEFSDTGLSVTQGSTLVAANCIYWGNVRSILAEAGTNVTITYSDIQGGWPGDGNIDEDPGFVDPAAGEFTLSPFSRCIDSGDNSAVPAGIKVDLAGLPRFVDDSWMPNRSAPPVDMGAYEFQGNSCSADWNTDGALNSQDFFDFLGDFFALNADLNGDGLTNSQDLFDFLQAFFTGCPS